MSVYVACKEQETQGAGENHIEDTLEGIRFVLYKENHADSYNAQPCNEIGRSEDHIHCLHYFVICEAHYDLEFGLLD